MVRASQVMRAERIQTEIMIEVAPDSMDVIRIVLCIVVLDHECRPLDAIVVRLAGLTAAGPCEVDVLEPRSSQFRELLVSEFLPQAVRVFLDQVGQHFLLFLRHLTQRDADRRSQLSLPGSAGNDIIHPWPLTGVADPEGIWPRHDEIRYRQVGWAPVNFQIACHPLAEGPRCVICSEFLPLPSRPSEKLGGD